MLKSLFQIRPHELRSPPSMKILPQRTQRSTEFWVCAPLRNSVLSVVRFYFHVGGTSLLAAALGLAVMIAGTPARATPANRIALGRYYGKFLARSLDNCT